MPENGWGRSFDVPIALPDGRRLVVLRDAANYITALAKEESALPEWQAAIEAPHLGGRIERVDDVRAHRHHASFEPASCPGVSIRSEKTRIGAGAS
jgi:hypothetical protein